MSVYPYGGVQYSFLDPDDDGDGGDVGNPLNPRGKQKAHKTQLVISVSLGLLAFLLFCFLRPRWDKLYAARKRRLRAGTDNLLPSGSPGTSTDGQLTPRSTASLLPDLPKGFFAWIPILYNIDEHEVLASAGLDAFVFLGFFKMAIKFLLIAAVFGALVLLPLHKHYGPNTGRKLPGYPGHDPLVPNSDIVKRYMEGNRAEKEPIDDTTYLWAYVFFVWLFSLVCIKLLVQQTERVVDVRQDYLGTHCTATDRTIRLSGIPETERDEAKIKGYVEMFGVGEVEKVMICRNWHKIDELMDKRDKVLRSLEEAYTILLKKRAASGIAQNLPTVQPRRDEAREPLLEGNEWDDGYDWINEGPTVRIRSGLKWKKHNAVQYYTTELERLDQKIIAARKEKYPATASAFVTMKSAASAQMAVQTLLHPKPHHYGAHLAPAPKDIIWRNTYMSKRERLFRAWTISICISFLTIIWLIPVSFLAAFLNIKSIEKFWPALAGLLKRSELVSNLVQNFAPTLFLTLLNVAIPYLYDYLSQFQGMISQSDVELSVISKNFFFTFFNLFFAFSVFGTGFNMYSVIKDSLHDTTKIAFLLAGSLEEMAPFYINLIILQGLGMFPVRLLDFGSLFIYPFQRLTARTARARFEIERPPVFKYGFYLPQPILILILCIVYSVMPSGGMIIFFGLVYFVMGYFIFKYQLLYAMSHSVHSTGKAWPLICYRIIVGLLLFQMAMAALLAARKAFYRALMVFPILSFTIWFAWYFRAVYAPLTEYVALMAIKYREGDVSPVEPESRRDSYLPDYRANWDGELAVQNLPSRNRKDEERMEGTNFEHPGLTQGLEELDQDVIRKDVAARRI